MKKIFCFLRSILEGLSEDIHNGRRYKKALAVFLLLALTASAVSCSHHNRRHGDRHHHHHHCEVNR